LHDETETKIGPEWSCIDCCWVDEVDEAALETIPEYMSMMRE